ncbi:primosomal protein N' [Thermoflavimicrobium dichotomicum]|uniref:Replication restart protein PriA n=1 Tax=Thermoflavimicrobium dichotomicum TaxID=46223 RepID=A0A1I3SXC8_9BACL|nr:primosomal protein N' [Thermoflavimicrobium dichotomicum]SFJ61967.1 replication restart DNA helicase PriA [Thermoflavimicrobium dichotomicum]
MANEMVRIAEVIVDVPANNTDRPFDYRIPPELQDDVQVGSRVLVPFGHRKVIGYCIGIKTASSSMRLKSIIDVMDMAPPLTPELVQLGQVMAEEYLCHTITALQSMVPAVLKGTYQKMVKLHPESREPLFSLLSDPEQQLYSLLEKRGECTWEEVNKIPGMSRSLLKKLIEEERILVEERIGDRVTKQKVTWVWAADADQLRSGLQTLSPRAVRQREILQYFLDHPGEVELSKLLTHIRTTRSTVKRLVEQGWLCWEEREQYRDPYGDRTFGKTEPLPLTKEQQRAFQAIVRPIHEKRAHTILLHGVTGSGKTEIYLQAIEEVLRQKREAIVLVPEISLTPQMVQRFKGRFGKQVAVLHSRLSNGERYDEWRKIRQGEVQIAIGARSAIFAPFQNLGLIIIDEEHETSYKQEENPKYHARDIAKWRAQAHGATLVLGSATPAVESYFKARTGEYEWIQLTERVHGRPFPEVQVVDMREELRKGNRSMFSQLLARSLKECIERGEQAVLFLNRRGFATFVMCRSCGETLICPHCDITLTYHQTNQTVRCHYCGYAERLPQTCPNCQSKHIRHFGTGTQRVEAELLRQFPDIKVIRMDVDTTSRKGAHERLLAQFRDGKAHVLLGTQMIAKGLDFPKVTLVGVIAADTMLHLPDFRAAERTFQLLMQVGGRAGRHEQPGKVIIQTYSPDHYSIHLAATYQTEMFYRQELLIRKRHVYPPFCSLFTIMISHVDRIHLMKYGQQMAQFIRNKAPADCHLLGPVPPPIAKLKDRYRLQMLIKCQTDPKVLVRLKHILHQIENMFDDRELVISMDREIMNFPVGYSDLLETSQSLI